MAALARRLQQRGHKVVIFGIADTEARVRSAGIDFQLIGAADYPLGTLQKLDQRLGELNGLATFRFTVERVKNTARMILRDGPEAARNANLDAMLIDEADMGGTVAEHLGLPFVSIAFFPPLIKDDRIPPFCFGWPAGQDPLSRLRNRLGMRLLSRVAAPIYAVVNQQRKAWNLKPLTHSTDALSPLAQITQLPQALEFATANKPANLHYTGPFVDNQQRPPVPFPGIASTVALSSTPPSALSRTAPRRSSKQSPKPAPASTFSSSSPSAADSIQPASERWQEIPSSSATPHSSNSSSEPPPSSRTPA